MITPNQFFPTLQANIDNDRMSDTQFRDFVRRSTAGMTAQAHLGLLPLGRNSFIEGDAVTLAWIGERLRKSERTDEFVQAEGRIHRAASLKTPA
jgi:hypothetical protein